MGVEAASRANRTADEDLRAWAGLASAQGAAEFCAHWLTIQCLSISGVVSGLVLMQDEPGTHSRPVAWPSGAQDLSELTGTAERALRDARSVVVRSPSGEAHIAHPVMARGKLWCAVAVRLNGGTEADIVRTIRALHWGSGWLEALSHRDSLAVESRDLGQQDGIVQMLRSTAASVGTTTAALSLTNLLATKFNCSRVAVGVAQNGRVKVLGLSHSAILDRRSKVAIAIASAMEEALDQAASVSFPPSPLHDRRIAIAHRDLVREDGGGAVLSVVMMHENRPVGVITLSREEAETFAPEVVEFSEKAADALGPIMDLQVMLDRPIAGRIPALAESYFHKLTGPHSYGAKIATAAGVLLLGLLLFGTTEYRVSGKATLEGIVQQAAVAPFDGFVLTAPHRAGDVVRKGDLLATMDTRELTLDELRYESQRDEATLREQEATAKGDRAMAAVESANAREAEAQRALAADKVTRANISAPFDGLVVSGDLSQALGSPVERGRTLFEIAPLDSYRVNLAVDERDIAHIARGQRGQLVLTGYSAESMGFTVNKIVPVANAANGANTFRVEAALDRTDPRLRPGMEGVGKVDAGRETFGWIWTHALADWARLTLWKWQP